MNENEEFDRSISSPTTSSPTTGLEFGAASPAHRWGELRNALRPSGCKRLEYATGLLLAALLALTVLAAPTPARAASWGVGIYVNVAPPPLPVYAQPVCPGPGYFWTPGYWAYDAAGGYYWVPGAWVMAPTAGFLWTPGYWGWGGHGFIWHAGYWGPQVGFYGGVDYGFGYPGVGYAGGYWRGGSFFYNRSVNNLGEARFANVYSRPVANNSRGNRVSYNGGAGGLRARPTPGEMAAEHERHIAATPEQHSRETTARSERSQFASANHGQPAVRATREPDEVRAAHEATRSGGPVNTTRELRSSNAGHTKEMARNNNEPRSPKPNHPKEAANNKEFQSPRSTPPRETARNKESQSLKPSHTNESTSGYKELRGSNVGRKSPSTHEEAKNSSHPRSTSEPRYQASRGEAPARRAPVRPQPQHNSERSEGKGHAGPHGR